MPTIRQLSPSLINKIAAGEVIERPASVVKELLENSVDAGATSIELSIEGGGIDLIRISDNGCGIDEEQIPLAIASHATSKLETADDLFDVHTLGFRGEALASISEVSHLTLRTRTAETDAGSELSVRGGEATAIVPTGCPVGTIIEVRHLFFNTPVRRKFLRTPSTEAGHISEAFTRIALAFPEIQFTMRSGNRVQYELPATEHWKDRIRAFFGDEVADALMEVESIQDDASLRGYVADPSVSRSNNRMQYIFLNGRHIRDRSLQHALGEAYRGLLMVGRFPICFLRMNLSPQKVDVNVHPTKMEVRFQEGGKLYSQLLKTLRHQFLTTDLTARARHVPGPVPAGLRTPTGTSATSVPVTEHTPMSSRSEARWDQHAEQVSSVAKSEGLSPKLDLPEVVPEFRPFHSSRSGPIGVQLHDRSSSAEPGAARLSTSHLGPEDLRDRNDANASGETAAELPPGAVAWSASQAGNAVFGSAMDSLPALPDELSRNRRVDSGTPTGDSTMDDVQASPDSDEVGYSRLGFQVHNRYLITQDENGMVVVDQHALHERILYERFRQKTEARSMESQKLLVPEPLDLTPREAAAALEFRELLEQIGIEVEPFGGDTILMTSYPAMLGKLRPADVLRQVLEPLMSGGKQPDARELLDEILNMLACKAAVKAGDKLAPEEITALLEQRDCYQDTHHCPHGRPTALFFSREQLDKMFKRT
ncbi:DNA mismatch repair endonuclease MutL [Aureliella helgolandensis]|uniref:DNA mismatch repair protein MutL n=1 Tax=Aureliella helgolandensis TaxID=2527968 RepID=A0A518G8S4_9BACT|nr:DNA mismatch repair endonuclease MutL [Aureliella helgolandensis]QDV24998.1 DNA mismatch repair protein MutL [Aureliella helgolandensis]